MQCPRCNSENVRFYTVMRTLTLNILGREISAGASGFNLCNTCNHSWPEESTRKQDELNKNYIKQIGPLIDDMNIVLESVRRDYIEKHIRPLYNDYLEKDRELSREIIRGFEK